MKPRVCIFLIALVMLAPEPQKRVQILRATSVTWSDEPVTVMIRVEPMAENRALVVAALDEAGEAVRSSLEQLDGDTAPRTRWLTWPRLPAGDLVLVAAVFNGTGQVGRDTRPIHVEAR